MTLKDTFGLSWGNVKSNKLRTTITIIIMALGIFALILIITAIEAASNSLTTSFSTMGGNAFSIRYKERFIRFGGNDSGPEKENKHSKSRQKKSQIGIPVSYDDAKLFKDRYHFPGSKTGLVIFGARGIVVNTNKNKTSPEINVIGGDENYLELNGYNIRYGRNFVNTELSSGINVCMLGSGVAATLFPENPSRAIDEVVNVDHKPYRVIAVLEDKGSSAFFNTGKVIITTVNNVRRNYPVQNTSYGIAVKVDNQKTMDIAIGEAIGTFRPIRNLTIKDADNFSIEKSDSIASTILKSLGFLQVGTIGIAFITLLGAAIGLMNIMLVAVNERTKEIGLSKAMGGTKKDIRYQFLFESVIISLLGAAAGIVAGIALGNVLAFFLKTGFVIPWNWVFIAIVVCSAVGLAAGLYPAYKASKLDPIVALRYE